MERVIKHYFRRDIVQKIKMDNCWKNVWILTLSDGQVIVFRSLNVGTDLPKDIVDGANRHMTEIYNREKFFYDKVNKELGNICPNVLVIDDSCEYYPVVFQITDFIEGTNLQKLLSDNNICNDEMKKDIYYRMGILTAKINKIEIDSNHPYISSRKSWENYFANKLRDTLAKIVDNNFITKDEIQIIASNMEKQKAEFSLSFLHNDIRPDNFIINNDSLFLLDAEECEFGDPLHELARISQVNNNDFLNGYKNEFNIDIDNELYYYYKLEELGMLLDCHFNRGANNSLTKTFLNSFNEIKYRLLQS